MDDNLLKNRIKNAFQIPKPNPSLVNNISERCRAITLGNEAEKKLKTMAANSNRVVINNLAAQAVVGRLMKHYKIPDRVNNKLMVSQLLANEKFLKAINFPPNILLKSIENGALIKSFAQKQADSKASEKTMQKTNENLIKK